jgi:DNA-binding NarL/FixJ family response regulator
MHRVFLVQKQKLIREGLRLLIDREPDLCVVGDVAEGEEALAQARATEPDVMLLDLDSIDIDCFELASQVQEALPALRVVAMSTVCPDETIARALERQIRGFCLKEEGFAEMGEAIRHAARGEYHYARRVMDRVVTEGEAAAPTESSRTRLQNLTPREMQLLRLLATGMSLKKACMSLHVSYKTGDKHKVNLMKKLDIHDRVELARFAIREKIIEP